MPMPRTPHHPSIASKGAPSRISRQAQPAKAIGTGLPSGAGALQHRFHLHLGLKRRHIAAVVDRLGAIGAVFFAAPVFTLSREASCTR